MFALKKITPKIGDVLEYFMLTSILHEGKNLVLKEWNNRTIVIEMFLGLPESYVCYISRDKVRSVLVALNHELLLQALSTEQMME